MTPTKAFSPAASWTHKLNSERAEEHDFSNLIVEFGFAVQRQDRMMMEYCEGELKRMFKARAQSKRLVDRAALNGSCGTPV
jgi:hypothetical protein